MNANRTALALGALLLPASSIAAEQKDLTDLSIEQLMQIPVETVYTASRYGQKANRAPASVTVVGADEIARFGYRTLADILRSVAGFVVTYDRNYSFLGVRGFSRPGDFNTRVLLLIDGHRVNDALYGLTYIGQEAVLDVDMIDRVEIIRGPASSIYGNSAILGVVNVITRQGKRLEGLELGAEGGSFDSYKARVSYGRTWSEDLAVTLSGAWYESAGHHDLYYPEFDTPASNDGHAIDADAERAARFFASVSYRDFNLSAGYSDRYKNVPTAPYGAVFNSRLFYTEDRRGYFDLKYEHAFATDLQVLARATYDWYPYTAEFPYENPTPPPDPLINRDLALSRWARAELQVTKHLDGGHVLIAGAEYQDSLRLHQGNYNVEPFESFADSTHSSRNYGVYAQGEAVLPANLLLNAGVRYDHFQSFGNTVNPRAGVIYSPWQNGTFKVLYGRAFRAPSDYEVFYQSRRQLTNVDLEPERISTRELVYEQYVGVNFRFSVAAYRYRIRNLISLVDAGSGLLIFENTDRARSRGVELQVESRFANGFSASGHYSLQRSEDVATGDELGLSPRHLARIGVGVPLYKSFLSGNVEARYTSSAITVGRQKTGGYALLDMTLLSRNWLRNTDISASIYNLFDRAYVTPAEDTGEQDFILQDGRTFRVKVTWRR